MYFPTDLATLSVSLALALLPLGAHAKPNRGNGSLGTFSWDTTKYMFAFGDSYSASDWKVEKGILSTDKGKTTSNGMNWVQYLTRKFNATDVLLRNLAHNGASIDNDLIAVTDHETGVAQQVAKFEEYLTPPPDELPWEGSNTLFSIWVGINDCDLSHERLNQAKWHRKEFKVWTSLQERLYDAGARHFLFMTVPPTYSSPLFFGRWTLRNAIKDYNQQLRSNAIVFQREHPDAVVLFYDAHKTFGRILDNAWQEGFKNTTEACPAYMRGTPSLTTLYKECVNPVNEYIWLDKLHPTAGVHQLIAKGVKRFLDHPTWLPHDDDVNDVYYQDTSAQEIR